MRRRRFRCEGRNQKYQTASTMSAGTRKLRLTRAMSGAKITATTSKPDVASHFALRTSRTRDRYSSAGTAEVFQARPQSGHSQSAPGDTAPLAPQLQRTTRRRGRRPADSRPCLYQSTPPPFASATGGHSDGTRTGRYRPSAPSASGAAWPTGESAACGRHVVREQGKVRLVNSQISELESLFVLRNPSVDKQQDCRDLDSNADKHLLVGPVAGHAKGPRAESDE